ncbi:MAG TPA: pyridoxal 5'-phosphate synthase glutaminase subunit PdxT [Candidatus Polarisedimenticolaceae bacterium]|nr:pyridoxal 5'-phosphate synthase glutaminase subunit PdxT [Candidatus Polarisedimenticolaceae bacterium]
MERIGILALQGDFARHAAAFAELGQATAEVRHVAELARIDGLVIPGGESTTLLKLMEDEPWFDGIRRFHDDGGAVWGTCAGAILLAREVLDPCQPSVGLLDAVIRRNAFGRQIDSFETELSGVGRFDRTPAVFIRAPRFVALGAQVDVLARLRDEPVLVRQGRVLAATFHAELTADRRLQQAFIRMIGTHRQPTHEPPVPRTVSEPAHPSGAAERRISC